MRRPVLRPSRQRRGDQDFRPEPHHRTRRRIRTRWLAAGVVAVAGAALALWIQQPANASSTTYQAESASLSGGAVAQSDHAGYTGSGFVGGYTDANKGSAATTFPVTAASATSYTLTLRYANGTTQTKTISLYVDGSKVRQVSLAATANWDSWATEVETVSLAAGTRSIAYKFDSTDSGNVNLDSLTVADVSAPPPGTYEAESAALSGGATVATDHSGFTGTGFVAGYTDGNKGNAQTQFTVPASYAGAGSVVLRYANGTGATMTLSLYVNGARTGQVSLPATANWDTWGTVSSSVTLNAGSNTIAYRFDSTDSGNVNLDNIAVTGAASPTPSASTPPPSGTSYEAETGFFSGGPSVATATSGYSGTGYLTGFTGVGARLIRTVNVSTAGNATVTLRYNNATGATRTLSGYANGLRVGQLSLPAGSGWLTATQTMSLRAGLNIVGYSYDSGDSGSVALDQVTVSTGVALATRGATLPYTEYEAEAGSTNGTVLAASRTYGTLAAEASGRRAVQLTATGQYVQWTLTAATNSILIRYSIPDSSDGAGLTAPIALYANGSKVQDITLTSKYSWTYGAYPYTGNPADGSPHHFYDESRALIGNWAAGTVLKLQKDASSSAPSYTIDLIDTEQVAAAFTMPANYLPVTSYGATANDGSNDTGAFTSAIAAAQSQGKGVWIPAGTFNLTSQLNIAGVPIRGAGPWYSFLQGAGGLGGLNATGSNTIVADFTIDNAATYRNDCCTNPGLEGNFGSGSLVYDVWMDHDKVGMWPNSGTNGLYIVGVRIRDQWADGLNLHADVHDSRVDNSSIRNTGDDALAMFSEGTAVTGCSFTFNTISDPMLANGIGIYGGTNNTVADNLISDIVVNGSGITVSTWFGIGFSGTTLVTRNTLTRTGSHQKDWGSDIGAIWVYANVYNITSPVTISYNTVNDSSYQAILLSYGMQITNLVLDHDTITGAGTWGIDLYNVTGSMTASYVTVSGAGSGGLNNPGGYTINRGAGNSGW